MGADAVRATMMGNMRDAMKDDVEKLLQVRRWIGLWRQQLGS